MTRRSMLRVRLATLCLTILVVACGSASAAAPDVAKLVNEVLATRRGYQRGDLISQTDWDGIAKKLAEADVEVKDAGTIRGAILPESDFLVQESRNKNRREFFRESGRSPLGYDRLEHLSRLSDGHRIITRLADGRDGYKLVEYLATSSGGKEMGKMLSVDPGGKDFNQPTGRIYTADQLVERLTGKAPPKSRDQRGRVRSY